jgi:hypothetical protein
MLGGSEDVLAIRGADNKALGAATVGTSGSAALNRLPAGPKAVPGK